LAQFEGGTVVASLRHIGKQHEHAPISENTTVRYVKERNFSYNRYWYGLKKRNEKTVEYVSKVIGKLGPLNYEQQCELLYFDESGFNPSHLYSQQHFPSLDYTLSFHVRLMARVRSCSGSPD
jgi:DNA-dependent RNA polymerase auxiliary subunit epsilon